MVAIAKAISSGSLRGARGNSELSCPSFFVALQRRSGNIKRLTQLHLRRHERATATAYKAVMKPKEGTILTVAKEHPRRRQSLQRQQKIWIHLFQK